MKGVSEPGVGTKGRNKRRGGIAVNSGGRLWRSCQTISHLCVACWRLATFHRRQHVCLRDSSENPKPSTMHKAAKREQLRIAVQPKLRAYGEESRMRQRNANTRKTPKE